VSIEEKKDDEGKEKENVDEEKDDDLPLDDDDISLDYCDEDPNAEDEIESVKSKENEVFIGIENFPMQNKYSPFTYLIPTITKFLPNKKLMLKSNKLCFALGYQEKILEIEQLKEKLITDNEWVKNKNGDKISEP